MKTWERFGKKNLLQTHSEIIKNFHLACLQLKTLLLVSCWKSDARTCILMNGYDYMLPFLPYICWSNPWAVHSWQGEFLWSLVFAFCYKIPRSFSWTNVSSPRPWEHLGQGNPCDFPPSVWKKTRMIKTCFNTKSWLNREARRTSRKIN